MILFFVLLVFSGSLFGKNYVVKSPDGRIVVDVTVLSEEVCFSFPGTIGTRCHQLAMFVVYESPIQMLSDSPSNYYRESECMEFLSAVPTVWDETRVIDGSIGDFVVVARRSGSVWYIGAMTDENDREFEVVLDFIDGDRSCVSWADGVNVKMRASDFVRKEQQVKKGDKITLKLNGGGGYAAIIK